MSYTVGLFFHRLFCVQTPSVISFVYSSYTTELPTSCNILYTRDIRLPLLSDSTELPKRQSLMIAAAYSPVHTVAENGETTATVSLFCDSVDRLYYIASVSVSSFHSSALLSFHGTDGIDI